jgi:large subunit ribosomal protein L6
MRRRARKTSAENCSATSGNNFMSRIGKQPIAIPAKVKVEVKGQKVLVEGPKGKLDWELPAPHQPQSGRRQHRRQPRRRRRAGQGVARFEPRARQQHGQGRQRRFRQEAGNPGRRFQGRRQGKVVNLALGYSHPINYNIPDQIKVTVEENTKLTIEGPDKMIVGKVASEIRASIRRNLTRARASVMPANTSSARKARRSNNNFVHGQIREPTEMRTEKKLKLKQLRRWRIRKKSAAPGTSAHERPLHQRKHPRPVHRRRRRQDPGRASTVSKGEAKELSANVAGAKKSAQIAAEGARTRASRPSFSTVAARVITARSRRWRMPRAKPD